MTIYLVAWLSVAMDCPFWAKPLPKQAQNFICTRNFALKTRVYDPALRQKAEQHLEALGPSETAVLLEIRGTQARAISHVWRPTLYWGGQ